MGHLTATWEHGIHRTACVLCIFLLAAAALVARHARAEGEEAAPAELSRADVEAIKALLKALANAIVSGEAEAIGPLLSPSLPGEERERIVSRARGEFGRLHYIRFAFKLDGDLGPERLPDGRVHLLVPAEYEYEDRSKGSPTMAGAAPNSYPFTLEKTEGGWGIVESDIFEQFTSLRLENVLGWIFFGAFVAVLAVFFCAWMAFDAWMHFGRPWHGILVLALTPVGPVAYFFAVYLRRRLMLRRSSQS